MDTTPRDLEVLLMIVGAVDGLPVRDGQIADAYKTGAITGAEGKMLQRYARLSPRGRKAIAPPDITDAKLERIKMQLEAAHVKLLAKHPHLRGGDVR